MIRLGPSKSARLLLSALFAAAVTGAWAWFHIAPPSPGEHLRFDLARSLDGWQFESHPVDSLAAEMLATTNLVNGAFTSRGRQAVTVFAAEWRADEGQSMNVVQHTPDVCWVWGGWIPVKVGQPERVSMKFGDRSLPFECRVFSHPGSGPKVLVLWCTLVGGQVLEESDRWAAEKDAGLDRVNRFATAGRRMGLSQFMDNVRNRRLAAGQKQFVRLSTPVSTDWNSSLGHLRDFAPTWLTLQVATNDAGSPVIVADALATVGAVQWVSIPSRESTQAEPDTAPSSIEL